MAGVGKRIEEAVKALDEKQIKKALWLTTKKGAERQHGWVEDAARTCLSNRDDQEACDAAIKTARDKMKDSITAPIDNTDLDGLEKMLSPQGAVKEEEKPVEENAQEKPQMSDEELYQSCPECHVADAVVKFIGISKDDCNGETGKALGPLLQDETTPPEKWLKAMREVASMDGCGKEAYKEVLGGLETYLKEKDSEILKKADEGVSSG